MPLNNFCHRSPHWPERWRLTSPSLQGYCTAGPSLLPCFVLRLLYLFWGVGEKKKKSKLSLSPSSSGFSFCRLSQAPHRALPFPRRRQGSAGPSRPGCAVAGACPRGAAPGPAGQVGDPQLLGLFQTDSKHEDKWNRGPCWSVVPSPTLAQLAALSCRGLADSSSKVSKALRGLENWLMLKSDA